MYIEKKTINGHFSHKIPSLGKDDLYRDSW